MYALEDLWAGKITPSEKGYREGSEYEKLSRQVSEKEAAFRKELSAEGKRAFDRYESLNADLGNLSECDTFIRGFRLGARVILDVIGEYASPMIQVNEMGREE